MFLVSICIRGLCIYMPIIRMVICSKLTNFQKYSKNLHFSLYFFETANILGALNLKGEIYDKNR